MVLFLGTHEQLPSGSPIMGLLSPRYSLNFRVSTEAEASELPKSLVLGKDGNIHIRLTGCTPLGNVGLTIHPLRGPTSSSAHFRPGIGSDTKLSHPGLDSAVARYCPLWAPTTPSRFCFWELTSNFPVGHPSWDCSGALLA